MSKREATRDWRRQVVVGLLLSLAVTARAAVPKRVDVVIVGAGLAGLATAYELKKAKISYHLLEISPRVGGRVQTVRYERDGETLYADSGMEEYWESNPAVEVLKELKLPVRRDVAVSSIVLGGQLHVLGDESPSEFRKRIFSAEEYAALEKFRAELEPLSAELRSGKPVRPELMKLKETSFAAWVGEKQLPPKVANWVRVSVECEIGTHWDRIAALDGIAEFHIFLGNEGEEAVRVLGGNEKFTDALAKAVGERNISTNKRVKSFVRHGEKVAVSYLDTQTNRAGEIVASHAVSTIPLYRLFEVQFDPPLREEKARAIQTLGWGSYFKAHLFVPATASRFWTKNGASFLPILSDSELGVIYEGNPEQNTRTKILSLLVSGDTAERYNLMPLDAVRAEIRAAFEKLWPGFSKEIRGIEFYRYHPRAIAAWGVGRSRFDELSEAIRVPENGVYLAGDFTESSHSDGAFKSAHRVVRQIREAMAGKGNRRQVSGEGGAAAEVNARAAKGGR